MGYPAILSRGIKWAVINISRFPNQAIDELGAELVQLADTDTSKILLDFSNIAFLSSAALSRLIVMHKHCLANAVSLKLSGMTPDIEKVFTVTRLNTLFDIHAEQAGALAGF